ncbi:P22AR C-terminal domain-containing protein [Mannheimia indoligenes]|uniref:P22AR C-terminal domain-containing protein n=1 Tax=Mannheimia indoligenes TaxID=3103145 RepID=A0ABU7ZEY2_9PAST
MTTLTFQNTAIAVINRNNKTFFSATDLGLALSYTDPVRAVKQIYDRNADEFTPEMTALIEMQTNGGKQQVRIFSLRGAHLIAMFARTKVAKEFRKWVLDILDKEVLQNSTEIRPLASPKPVEKIFNHNIINHEAVDLAWLWFEANHMAGFIKEITPALEALGSSYAPKAHSIAYEYGRHLHDIGKLVYRLSAEADFGHNPRPMRELESHFAKPTKSVRIAKF